MPFPGGKISHEGIGGMWTWGHAGHVDMGTRGAWVTRAHGGHVDMGTRGACRDVRTHRVMVGHGPWDKAVGSLEYQGPCCGQLDPPSYVPRQPRPPHTL